MRFAGHLLHRAARNVAILAYDLSPDPRFSGAGYIVPYGGSFLLPISLRAIISHFLYNVGLSADYDRRRDFSVPNSGAHYGLAAIFTLFVQGTFTVMFITRASVLNNHYVSRPVSIRSSGGLVGVFQATIQEYNSRCLLNDEGIDYDTVYGTARAVRPSAALNRTLYRDLQGASKKYKQSH
jgi:hypothetical protein